MCGRYRVRKTPGFVALAESLGIQTDEYRFDDDCRPGALVSIVAGSAEERRIIKAVWWLYLEQTETGLKPHKDYFSINTNFKKLPKKYEYRRSRCIILLTDFVESKESKSPYLLSPADGRALAFGGLFKQWVDKTTGEVVHSASMITLDGHDNPLLDNIHDRAFPLWLPYDDRVLNRWLDPKVQDTAEFEPLLKARLHTDLQATPIDKASLKNPVGAPIIIPAD